jgi:2'-5' RNA ligase
MHSARPSDRLFVAAFPDPRTASHIHRFAWRQRQAYRLRGRPTATDRLHVTLWHVSTACFEPPRDLVNEVVRRLASIDMPPFRVSFDRLMSFRNGALVLGGDDGVAGLEIVHAMLVDGTVAITPHMTLLRDERHVLLEDIDPPIKWTVSELVLVHSLLGRTIHRHLVRVPLRPFTSMTSLKSGRLATEKATCS